MAEAVIAVMLSGYQPDIHGEVFVITRPRPRPCPHPHPYLTQNWTPEARRQVLRARHAAQLPAPRKEAVLLETALFAATQASMPSEASAWLPLPSAEHASGATSRLHSARSSQLLHGAPAQFTTITDTASQIFLSCDVQGAPTAYGSRCCSRFNPWSPRSEVCTKCLEICLTG